MQVPLRIIFIIKLFPSRIVCHACLPDKLSHNIGIAEVLTNNIWKTLKLLYPLLLHKDNELVFLEISQTVAKNKI